MSIDEKQNDSSGYIDPGELISTQGLVPTIPEYLRQTNESMEEVVQQGHEDQDKMSEPSTPSLEDSVNMEEPLRYRGVNNNMNDVMHHIAEMFGRVNIETENRTEDEVEQKTK